ncbi:TRAP transporter substrate-binding protein DctP [Belnapia sp. T6]|uniref:TRAP transporter substrate-binding protein DctP n=1 Tax=Belnapia mucosa TaxID=2804532 RepID=A0ABS1UW49_9PROT|nr:TRAP transporter substrate-binding protein DctP [Belnapia mucosa]MBL6453705.1 TRAP transporter substrate-binding protein DctP [Belnapia mucosa]
MLRWLIGALSCLVVCALARPAAAEAPAPIEIRVISGFAAPRQFRTVEIPFWTRQVPELTDGRVSVALRSPGNLGLAADHMLTVMRNGVVLIGTLEVSALVLTEPELGIADLPLLSEDAVSQRRMVDLWQPRLAQMLQDRYGIELLAVFLRPPQVMACNRPFASLLDLAGRRIRIASVNQADLVIALGASPVVLGLDRVMEGFREGVLDCVVTGTPAASGIGLHRVVTHVSTVPLGWSMAFLTAHAAGWAALPGEVRGALQAGIRQHEAAIWRAAETQREEGEACLLGQPACPGERGTLTLVVESAANRAAIRALFVSAVLPGWARRCGIACAEGWNAVAGPVLGVFARW